MYDVLNKRTIDKVLKLLRKLNWDDSHTRRVLHKVFTKPYKLHYGNIALLAMLTYDLQRYHPEFAIAVADQVMEDIRRGLEQNVYSANQRRVAAVKYLGELYIYRLISSGLIFDTFWAFVTFGHRKQIFWVRFHGTDVCIPLYYSQGPSFAAISLPDRYGRRLFPYQARLRVT
jgi:regulator of nonsense transcripts 2